MADPKYAGLPGIVYDQPDTYETSDLPESEQFNNCENAEGADSSIEVLHLSSADAYATFKGKILDSLNVDFSDRISRAGHKGYSARRIEWEIGGGEDGVEETVVQKYQRLMCETNELAQEVQSLKGDVEHSDGKVSAAELNIQVDTLHKTLCDLKLEGQLGSEVLASLKEPQTVLQNKLGNLMDTFKNTGADKSKDGKAVKSEKNSADGKPNNATYELYYAPEHAKLNQLSRTAEIEKKIDYLENLIGHNPEKMSSLSAWTNHTSLLGAVQVLSNRLSLLEPSHLDHVEGRLHAVHTRMNSIDEKKNVIEDADKQSKVNELYELVKKSEAHSSALPEIVDRMISLEALHDGATQFSQSLKQLDVAQTQLTGVLQNNSQLLELAQDKFTTNLEVIQSSIASLNKRIQAIEKK